MIDLYAIAKAIGLNAVSVAEVGVNGPEKCSLTEFIDAGARAILVEPLPWCVEGLRARFPTANVIEAVCADAPGTVRLFDRGEGSWIDHVPEGCAPDEHPKHSGMLRREFNAAYLRDVQAVTFDTIDPGDLDILCVDVEGAEWFVIQRMKSRPRLVRVETHFACSGYRNPFFSEICDFMAKNGYRKIIEDVSDSLWVLL